MSVLGFVIIPGVHILYADSKNFIVLRLDLIIFGGVLASNSSS
jgi:hypothetical protein